MGHVLSSAESLSDVQEAPSLLWDTRVSLPCPQVAYRRPRVELTHSSCFLAIHFNIMLCYTPGSSIRFRPDISCSFCACHMLRTGQIPWFDCANCVGEWINSEAPQCAIVYILHFGPRCAFQHPSNSIFPLGLETKSHTCIERQFTITFLSYMCKYGFQATVNKPDCY